MISNPRDKGLRGKQAGGGSSHEAGKISEATPSTSSRQWSAFRNPRIVRVSRTFGGKDRHSKVCTVRGLRDRRIRLSVPTAIQLYDLQHKLGLSQPSKVVDWLLDATKNDIDKLPPLQIPLPGYGQFHQPVLFSHHQSNIASPFFDPNSTFIKDVGFHSLGIKIDSTSAADLDGRVQNCSGTGFSRDIEASTRAKDKQAETITEKGKWIRANEGGGIGSYSAAEQVSAQNFFPLATHSSMPTLLSNTNMPFVNSYHWEASNLSLSTEFGSHGFQSQAENSLNSPSPLHLSSGSQLFFCPPPPMPPLFPSYPPCVNDQSRDMNHFQLLSSSSSQHILPISRAMSSRTKPFSLNLNPGLLHFLNNNESNPGEDKTDS